jgi:nicotinate-nucleotide--dimethylbenzimidazole phosphoribosyltransferase
VRTESENQAAIAEAIAAVAPPDPRWSERARQRQARLTMPPGSLGRLLDVGRQLAALQRTDQPTGTPALVAVFAADHGVSAAGVSAYPAEVTGQMVANYVRGGAAVNVLARRAGADVRVVDVGVAHPAVELPSRHEESLLVHRIAAGTRNFLDEPAMTRAQAFEAVRVGLELGERWAGRDGYRVLGLGEMGIGNTTAAAALVAALTGAEAAAVVGRGTGISDAVYQRKCQVVAAALDRHRALVRADDPWDWLARLGGFEILGLAGLAIGAARHRALVVLDGLISSTAGLVAARLCPAVRGAFLAAHLGPEPGHRIVLEELGLDRMLELDLRLGEGTGAALVLPLIAAAADILRDMATFESAGVSGPVEPRSHNPADGSP